MYINLRMSAYWNTLQNSSIPPIPHQVGAAILLISTPVALICAFHMGQNLSVFYSSPVYSVFRPPVRSGYNRVLYTVSQTSVQNSTGFCRMLLSNSWICTCRDVNGIPRLQWSEVQLYNTVISKLCPRSIILWIRFANSRLFILE